LGRLPTSSEQGQRLGSKWDALQAALANRTAELATDLGATDPELVLVIEIIGDVEDFYRAVRRIDGLEFLAEIDEDQIDSAGVFIDPEDSGASVSGSLYLMATNQEALDEILQLWQLYQTDEEQPFPHNLGRWKQIFRRLSDVRRWSAQDRIRGTRALEDFAARAAAGQEVVPAEIELWYREDPAQRAAAEAEVRQVVERAGGETVSAADIGEIAYHALLVSLPIQEVEPLLDGLPDQIALIQSGAIAFLRPEMQAAVESVATQEPDPPFPVDEPTEAQPIVGMLDGLPLANHELLGERIIIDDPDDWSSDIPAGARVHGTAIGSLILHGDGGADTRSLRTPVYARPVLRPETNFLGRRETMPHDMLPIDLIHRAVLRMVGPDGVVPSVRVINLSLGDINLQLANRLSPWARLLDWLSYTYRILFVVSAGNHCRPIEYPLAHHELDSLPKSELRRETIDLLVQNAAQRRILSPSECMNGICVGAAHHDNSESWIAGARRDILPVEGQGNHAVLFSPISAAGMGYRRSIKPDLLAPGGRMLFRFLPGPNGSTTANPVNSSPIPPGLQVASPTAQAGVLSGTQYFHGTSGSAAIASHYAGLIIEEISALEAETGDPVDPRFWSVLAKTLLVHAAELPESADELRSCLGDMSPAKLRDGISRFFGYGVVNPARVIACTAERATALGWGELRSDEAAQFDFPLPPSLSGKPVPRRLSVTVGYLSPIRNRDRRHRAAQLFISPDRDLLRLERGGADWHTVRRGTLQHEVLSGSGAAAFVDGDSLRVTVNCRSLVGTMKDPVLFGLAMTLEVDALATLPIYAEVADRIRLQARARARARA
jgi:hypothetical protein